VNKYLTWSLLAIALLLPERSHAVSITYTVVPLGLNSYRYTYKVSNPNDGSIGTGVSVELFDIDFDTTLYGEDSLTIVSSPALSPDWSQRILASAPGVPADYDVSALNGGIPVGSSVSGFAVEALWIGGPSGPGAQAFEVFDPTFELLQSGMTTPEQLTGVPEPSMLVPLGIGLVTLAGLGTLRRRQR
jgi:hypothetical protein